MCFKYKSPYFFEIRIFHQFTKNKSTQQSLETSEISLNYNECVNKNASVPGLLDSWRKNGFHIKSIFLQLGCYRFYFSFRNDGRLYR
jgi:hypothetical protein